MSLTRIVIPIFPGITHLDFTGPHQVLVRIPECEVIVASLDGQDIAVDGLVFAKVADLKNIDRCDVLCVPGGPGTANMLVDERFIAHIKRLGSQATYLTSVCTGALILGAAGFLRGHTATTHWSSRELLPLFGATISERRVERDGNLLTGGGVTAGIDFAFVLAAELRGRAVAEGLQLALEYAPAPPFDAGLPTPQRAARIKSMTSAHASKLLRAVQLAATKLEASAQAPE